MIFRLSYGPADYMGYDFLILFSTFLISKVIHDYSNKQQKITMRYSEFQSGPLTDDYEIETLQL